MKKNIQVALVTGASSGIGEAISRELVGKGWKVLGVARSVDKLQALESELKGYFIPICCDISDKENIFTSSQSILEKGYCPTLFFLNAGMAGESILEDGNKFSVSIHEKVMQVNYFGVLSWIEFWEKPCQLHDGAKFIVTSSINAFFAPPLGSAYSASKAAIAKAFESLSLTYYGTKLHFAVAYPGPVDTAGLKTPRKLPFTATAEEMAKGMVAFSLSNKVRYEPSRFYRLLTRFLNVLPERVTIKLLRSI